MQPRERSSPDADGVWGRAAPSDNDERLRGLQSMRVRTGIAAIVGALVGVGTAVGGAFILAHEIADSQADDRVAAAISGYQIGELHTGDQARIDELIEQALSKSASGRDCPFPDEPDPLPSPVVVEAELIGTFPQPTWVVVDPSTGHEFVVLREGRVVTLDGGRTVVDVTSTTRVEHDSGLMAAAIDASGAWMYLYQSSWIDPPDGARSTRILAVPLAESASTVAPTVILEVQVPTGQHAGGGIAVGPDDMLWVALGDGGGLGDPRANAQDPSVLLGKILRIDPQPESDRYAIPPDNPYADPEDGVRDEIVAVGLRNPWRLAFDAASGALWFGDVGQSCWEEIDQIAARDDLGELNFGWDLREATEPFQAPPVPPDDEPELTEPVFAYHHGSGRCAVTTGYPYRGDSLAAAASGSLLLADYCGDDVFVLEPTGSGFGLVSLDVEIPSPVAIVPDADGEPLVVSLWADGETQSGGGVYRLRSELGGASGP